MVGGGIEILRRTAVLLNDPGFNVSRIHRRAAEAHQRLQNLQERFPGGSFNFQAEVRRIAVRASDFEAFDFELALEFNDGVEDSLHQVRID